MLSDCWVAEVGMEVEGEEESRSPSVGAGALVFVSGIWIGAGSVALILSKIIVNAALKAMKCLQWVWKY